MVIIIDAEKNVLGRMATRVAKELLKGEEVIVINAEKAIITGNPTKTVEKYEGRRKVRDPANPKRSRKNSRRPDLFVKRIIRGMLPYKTKNGVQAYRRLKVYMGVPKEYEGKAKKVSESKSITSDYKFIEVKELCKKLGWKG
jgi:large subunit ribosomal protein L13